MRTKKLRPTRIVPGAEMLKQGPVWLAPLEGEEDCLWTMVNGRGRRERYSRAEHPAACLPTPTEKFARRSECIGGAPNIFLASFGDLPRERTAAAPFSGREWGDAAPRQKLSWLARHPSRAAKRIAHDLYAPMANRSAFLSTKGTLTTLLG